MVYFFKRVQIMRFPGEATDTLTLKPRAKYVEVMHRTECQKSERVVISESAHEITSHIFQAGSGFAKLS